MKWFKRFDHWLMDLPYAYNFPFPIKYLLELLVLIISSLLFPILIVQLIIGLFNNKTFNKGYLMYLQSIEGTMFFCYNNRKTSIHFIEQEIIPKLSPEIKIIFVNGRKLQTEYNTGYLSHALYQIKRTVGFPYLLKVVDGKMADYSINKELFDIINKRKNKNIYIDQLMDRINAFYSSSY